MQEGPPKNTQEEKVEQDPTEEEMLAAYMDDNQEDFIEKEKVPYTPEMAKEMEEMFSGFEKEFSLIELTAIKTKEEALESPLRIDAMEALVPVRELFRKIRDETEISEEDYTDLRERLRVIDYAVGVVNSGMLDH